MWSTPLAAFVAGAAISSVTAPVGVSGAVFLLPVQLSVLGVASPAVTPTNLIFNVVAGPGALLRHRQTKALGGPLTRTLLRGTLPGVVIGAALRVFLVPGPDIFRLIVAALLLPLGVWLCVGAARPRSTRRVPARNDASVTGLALLVGVVGGIYGIGGGSILGPILVGRGMPISRVAPAALAATFVTSAAGAVSFGVLAWVADGDVAPDWTIGVACGIGGLVGGYTGARLQSHLPDRALRALLGILATVLAASYAIQAAATLQR